MIKLSKRLLKVAGKVKKNSIVVDVGTDHGLLPMYLVENKIVKRAIACDIVNSICVSTLDKIIKNGYTDKIEVICSDGLINVKDKEVDTIIIAGMGGLLICDILENSKRYIKNKRLILSPHRDASEVRRKLHRLGFKITQEEVLEDRCDKFYPIIIAIYGDDCQYTELDYELGKKNNKRDTDFINFITYRRRKIIKNIEKISKGRNVVSKIKKLETELEIYNKILGE